MSDTSKTPSALSMFAVFAGGNLSVVAFYLGTRASQSLPPRQAIAAILLANLLLGIYAGFIGVVSRRTGKALAVCYKTVFGSHGQILVSVVCSILYMCFSCVYAATIAGLAVTLFPAVPAAVPIIIFAAICTYANLVGYEGLAFLGKIYMPAIIIFTIYGLYTLYSQGGFNGIFDKVPATTVPFFGVVSILFAGMVTGLTFAGDMVRFSKKDSTVFAITISSMMCVALLQITALFYALGTGEGDVVKVMSGLGLSAAALVLSAALCLSSGQAVMYLNGITAATVCRVITGNENTRLNDRFWIVIAGVYTVVVGCIMYYFGATQSFQAFTSVIAIVVPPAGGTLLAHFFTVERDFDRPFEGELPKFRWFTLAIWIVSSLVAKFFGFGIPAFVGFGTAFLLYTVLGNVFRKQIVSASPDKESIG